MCSIIWGRSSVSFHFLLPLHITRRFRAHTLVPRSSSSSLLMEWSGALAQRPWCVGCLGGAGGGSLHSRKVTVALASWLVCNHSPQHRHSSRVWHHTSSTSPVHRRTAEAGALWFHTSFFFFLRVSFRSRITCWFSLDLKFQVWKQNTKSFHRPFLKPLKVTLLYLCRALSFTSLDLFLPANLRPWLGEQESFAFSSPWEMRKLDLKVAALSPGLV